MSGGYSANATIKAFELGETMTYANVGVYLHTDGKIYLAASGQDIPLGTLLASGAAGDHRDVAIGAPVVLVRCGGTATVGKMAQATTAGEFIDGTTDDQYVWGQFLESGSDNAEISMLLFPHVTNNISLLIHGGS